MFFNEGRDVISRADVGCLTAPMCVTSDNTKVHDIIKVEKGEMDASKEEENKKEVIYHDVTNLLGLLHLTVLAIHSVYDHQYTRPYSCHTG